MTRQWKPNNAKGKNKKRPKSWHHGPGQDRKFEEADSQLPWDNTQPKEKDHAKQHC